MQITLTLNEYELTRVLQDGTLLALSQSVNSGQKQNLVEINAQVKNEAQKSPQSEKKGADDKKVDKAPETQPDKKTESTAAVNEGGDNAPDEPPFEPDKNEGQEEGSGEEITLEEVRAKMAELTKAGKNAEVKALFKKYGASKLTEVNKKHYAALLKEASEL